jgi:MFS family permease
MVLYDFACCAVTFMFLIVMLFGHASVFAVGAVMVTLGIIGAMETPNGAACIPQLVAKDKLASANGVIQAVQSFSSIASPVIGGILYGAVGLRTLVTMSGAAFALAAMMELFIRIPFVKRARTSGMVQTIAGDLKDGFAYVWRDSFVRKLMVIAALLNFALTPCFIIAAPLVLRMTLRSSDTLYGVSMGLIEAAMILGALLMGAFAKRMRVNTMWRYMLGIAILFVPLSFSVTPVLLGFKIWLSFAIFLLSAMLMAATMTVLNIFAIVQIQTKTPSVHLGKVMAIIQMVAHCAAPIGQLLYGGAFEHFIKAAYIPLLFAGGLMFVIVYIGKILLKKEGVHDDTNCINT